MVWIFALASEIIYLFILFKRLQVPLLDLHQNSDLFLVLACLAVLFFIYFSFYFFTSWKNVNVKKILLISVIFHITFLFVPFLTSDDLYSYIFSSRLLPIWGANPYIIPFDNFPYDPIYKEIKTIWSSQTVLYGPLFLLVGSGLNLIGQNNFSLLIYLFKITLIGANIISSILVFKLTNSKRALFLYSLNPLIIFELAGNAHSDSLSILLILIALLMINKKPVFGYVSLVASIFIKYFTLLLIPFFSIFVFRKNLRSFILMLILSIIFTVIIFVPFWNGLDIFNYLTSYYAEASPFPSLGILLGTVIFRTYEPSFNINTIFFLGIFVILTIKLLRSDNNLAKLILFSTFLYWAFVLTKLNLVLTWYLTPIIALSSLCLISKKYSKIGIKSIILANLYSLFLYWWVR